MEVETLLDPTKPVDTDAPVTPQPVTPQPMGDILAAEPATVAAPDDGPTPSADEVREAVRAFVGRCVTRELTYPTLLKHPPTEPDGPPRFLAAWRVLLADRREVEALVALAEALPRGEDQPPLSALEELLADEADRLTREKFAGDPFFARIHKKASVDTAELELRWLSALVRGPDEDAQVRGNTRSLNELTDKLGRWSASLGGRGSAGDYRLRLTLTEPPPHLSDEETEAAEAEGQKLWALVPTLLPVDADGDPTGEVVSADDVWDAPGATLGVLGRDIRHRRERLTGELERAASLAEVFGPLGTAARSVRPRRIELTTGEAFNFLRDVAGVLRKHDILVQLPPWADAPDAGVQMVMNLRPVGDEDFDPLDPEGTRGRDVAGAGSAVGLDTLLRFDWRVSVGGTDVSPEQFKTLLSKQRPLIKIDGQWIELDPTQAARAEQVLEATPPGDVTLGQAFGTVYRLSGEQTGEGGPTTISLSGAGWVSRLLDQSPTAERKDLPQPTGLDGTLRPYQLRGFQWLSFLRELGLGGCLADDMGLGKTIQTISLMLWEQEHDRANGATLLFAPTSVVGNWARELRRFAPSLKVHVHQGPERLHGQAFVERAKKSDVVITSYALAHRDVEDLREVQWHRLALDEAQKVKNPAAAGSKSIRSLRAGHRLALTGTPIENHLSELWSIMDLLNPGLMGSRREFRDRFANAIEKQKDASAADRLKKMIRPFILRRTKNDPDLAADLPPKMEMKVFCPLTAEQAAAYQRLTAEMLGQIDAAQGIRRRGLILAVLTRLKQLCDHPELIVPAEERRDFGPNRSGKCQRLLEMLEEVREEGESALVFTQYREMGNALMPMLQKELGMKVHFLHGGTPQPQRELMVESFQKAEEPQVFLLSLRAGGLGLNLTAARHVFHFDRWWNPAVENQATDRAHRIGQTKTVQVHKFVTLGTVEERIDKLLEDKSQLADNIVGSGDEWLTDLSTQELREYLALDTSATVSDE